MQRLACFLEPGRSLDEGTERVRLADSLGYDSVWVTHIAAREPLQLLNHYAHNTERIGLGTGVVPIVLRHPALTAMEAATLDEISGGRLRLGIGVSHRVTVEGWYGLSLDDPIGRMREYTTIVRQVLEQGSTGLDGEHYTARFSLMGFSARPGIPVLFAALAPKMLRLAAEVADGIVLWMCSPSYIRDTVRPLVEEVLTERGRDPSSFEIVAAVPCAITDDHASASAGFRKRALPYLQLPFYRRAIAAGGHAEDLAAFDRAMASGGVPEALAAVPDAFVDDYAGIGDERTVRAKIDEFRAAGVTLPGISPIAPKGDGGMIDGLLETLAG